jgi:Fur family transcriptional regulator, peroxide stress response regulator
MKLRSIIQQVNAVGSKPRIPAKKTAAAFKAAGLRMTRPRLTIYRELAGRADHPDVERLYQAVKKLLPKISLFTVYRTVNAFELAGLVFRVVTWKGHARYGAKMDAHAHFLCETCGRIYNVKMGDLEKLGKKAAGIGGNVRRVSVMIYGHNPHCSARSAQKKSGLKTSPRAAAKARGRPRSAPKGKKSSKMA